MLAEEEGRQLLLSKYALDCHAYNMAFEGVTWQVCDLRFWLNGEFALAAFDNAQRTRIARSELVNKDNDEYGTRGGEVTRDHVFCLSLDEVARYLATDANTHSHVGIARKDLVAIPTEYAKSRHINYDTIGGAWCGDCARQETTPRSHRRSPPSARSAPTAMSSNTRAAPSAQLSG